MRTYYNITARKKLGDMTEAELITALDKIVRGKARIREGRITMEQIREQVEILLLAKRLDL